MRAARRAKVRCELRAKIEINAIFVKCLYIERKVVLKGSVGMFLVWERFFQQILLFIGKSYDPSWAFTTCFISFPFTTLYKRESFSKDAGFQASLHLKFNNNVEKS